MVIVYTMGKSKASCRFYLVMVFLVHHFIILLILVCVYILTLFPPHVMNMKSFNIQHFFYILCLATEIACGDHGVSYLKLSSAVQNGKVEVECDSCSMPTANDIWMLRKDSIYDANQSVQVI